MKHKKYAIIEREKRYLVNSLPSEFEADLQFLRIRDRYILDSTLRLRRIESPVGEPLQYKIGQKYPADSHDFEKTWMTNIYLQANEYDLLSELPGNELAKRRYSISHHERKFSVDVFAGKLEGLILCELELPLDDNSSIELPDFIVKEVTDDEAYLGVNLASK